MGGDTKKATGIVRNIDSLGRITVPKEIRTQLSIADDTPLEMYVDDEGLYSKSIEQDVFLWWDSRL